MIEPSRRARWAEPAALALGLCSVIAGLIVLGRLRVGALAADAAFVLWWPLSGFWLLAAVEAWRRGNGLWAFATAPLVLFPLAVYGLLAAYCWESCEL